MEIRQLRTFRTVANLLSFHKAALQLHYAQSSISAQIQALEDELDVQLFDRLGRRIQLTEAGIQLLQYAEKIVDLADESHAELTGHKEPHGSLTIRIPESFGIYHLPLIVKCFRSCCPKVRLSFITCAHEGLHKDLRKGITDLAFLLAESIHSPDLEVQALGTEALVIVADKDHSLSQRAIVHTQDFEGETVLLSRVDCSYRKLFEQILDNGNVKIDTSLEFNSVTTLKKCVMAGTGITILPEIAVEDDVSQGNLVVLPWAEGKLEVALLMIWYKEKWVSPALKIFMETVQEVLGQPQDKS